MGTAAASAGAAGPSEGLRARQSSGRFKPEYPAASGRHDHATFGSRPTRQSDNRDSAHGPGMIYNSGKGLFYLTINASTFQIGRIRMDLRFFLSNGIFDKNRRCGFEL